VGGQALLWVTLGRAKGPSVELARDFARFDKIRSDGACFEVNCFFEANLTLSDCWVCGGTLMPIPLKAKMLLKSFLCCRCY
jgi:hypothetical protein